MSAQLDLDDVVVGSKSELAINKLAQLRADNAELLKKVDEAIAWHEGDCSPRALLEHELAQLRNRIKELEKIVYEAEEVISRRKECLDCYEWLANNSKEAK
jgi:predicted nuclease with TOPRIM domain